MRRFSASDFRRMSAACVLFFFLAAPVLAQTIAAQSAPKNSGPAADPAYMDRSVRPGDDFYQYACGTWQQTTEIPGDRGGVSPGTPLFDEHEARLKELIEQTVHSNAAA